MGYLGNAPADQAVQIGDGVVDTDQLAADAVTSAKIEDNAVDTEHLADDAIEAAELASDAVVNLSVASGAAIATSKLTGAVTSISSHGLGSLATLSTVAAATITDNSVGADELNVSGDGSSGQHLISDADGTFSWATPSSFNADAAQVFNESGADADFRVEGSGQANALFVQGSDGNVGIGNASPGSKLQVGTTTMGLGSGMTFQVGESNSSQYIATIVNYDVTGYGTILGHLDDGTNDRGILQAMSGNGVNDLPSVRFIVKTNGNVGIGTTGPDTLLVIGGTSGTGRITPATDNVGYIGESSHRWQAIYAVNGSIQTSDERQKTEITDTSLGLDFIKQLRPVSYKWKVGGYDVGDGVEIELEPEEVDSEGNVIKTAVMGLPKKEEIAGKRNHYGLIAQEVKEVLGDADFGGWVIDDLDDSESTQSLRYNEFISPLIKAVQELSAKVEALENA